MPPDPLDDRHHPMRQFRSNVCVCGLLGADESVHIPSTLPVDQAERQRFRDTRDAVLGITSVPDLLAARDAAEKAELDEWRATYGRLDIPVTVIDWPPILAGAAALGIALVARGVVRHGR